MQTRDLPPLERFADAGYHGTIARLRYSLMRLSDRRPTRSMPELHPAGRRCFRTPNQRCYCAALCIAGLAWAGCGRQSTQPEGATSQESAVPATPDRRAEAKAYLAQGDYDTAIRMFSELIAAGDHDPEVFSSRGEAYERKQQWDRAAIDYTQLIELQPDRAKPHLKRAATYDMQGDMELATQDCSAAIRLEPENPDAFSMRAAMEAKTGKLDAAIEDGNRSIALRSNFQPAYTNRGLAFLKQGQIQRAVDDFTKALQFDHDNFETYLNRGAAYLKLGKNDLALADWDHAIRITPGANLAYLNRGDLYLRLGKPAKAIDDFNVLIDHIEHTSPKQPTGNPRANSALGRLLVKRSAARLLSHDPPGALADLDRAAQLIGENAEIQSLRAQAGRTTSNAK